MGCLRVGSRMGSDRLPRGQPGLGVALRGGRRHVRFQSSGSSRRPHVPYYLFAWSTCTRYGCTFVVQQVTRPDRFTAVHITSVDLASSARLALRHMCHLGHLSPLLGGFINCGGAVRGNEAGGGGGGCRENSGEPGYMPWLALTSTTCFVASTEVGGDDQADSRESGSDGTCRPS